MRREQDRSVPVKAKLLTQRRAGAAATPPGINFLLLASPEICAQNISALRFGDVEFRIVRTVEDVKAVAEAYHPPIVVHDAGRLASSAGPGPGAVVLQPAHHVIKRQTVVGVNLVKLAQRHVVNRFPGFAAVVADGNAAVLSYPDAFRVLRVLPKGVIVDVDFSSDRFERLAAVDRLKQA